MQSTVDHFVSVNEQELQGLEHIGVPSSKLSHIPNAVDTSVFTPMNKVRSKMDLGLDSGNRYVLFVGKLTADKGASILVEAFAELPPEVHLLLVYSSVDQITLTKIRDLIEKNNLVDRVTFVGTVYNELLPVYYNAADLCAFPSRNEGFGVVVLEAMACETAVVGTTEHALAGHLRDGVNGAVVCPGAHSDLRDKLYELLRDKDRRRQLARRGREIVKKEYTWEIVIDEVVDTYYKY